MLKNITYLTVRTLLLIGICFLSGCGSSSDATSAQITNLEFNHTAIERVGEMRIFFGHQSVGGNILDGIETLQKNTDESRITITSTRESEQISDSGLYHAWIGENGSPEKKIDDFEKLIKSGIGNKIDVALMKFCFIDFNQNTDINKIFELYKNTMIELQKAYPDVTFVHTTIPLISNNMSLKDWIKKVLGRSQKNDADNVTRNKYNDLLRNHYQGKEPIWDLAEFESTYPDGKRYHFTVDGKKYEAMIPAYTDDGGHLNAVGSQYIAEDLLTFIATLTKI